MNGLCVLLIILAIILFTLGLIISILQKHMMQVNMDNTLSLTSNIDINKINDSKSTENVDKPVILKQSDTDELLNFIDDEIL